MNNTTYKDKNGETREAFHISWETLKTLIITASKSNDDGPPPWVYGQTKIQTDERGVWILGPETSTRCDEKPAR